MRSYGHVVTCNMKLYLTCMCVFFLVVLLWSTFNHNAAATACCPFGGGLCVGRAAPLSRHIKWGDFVWQVPRGILPHKVPPLYVARKGCRTAIPRGILPHRRPAQRIMWQPACCGGTPTLCGREGVPHSHSPRDPATQAVAGCHTGARPNRPLRFPWPFPAGSCHTGRGRSATRPFPAGSCHTGARPNEHYVATHMLWVDFMCQVPRGILPHTAPPEGVPHGHSPREPATQAVAGSRGRSPRDPATWAPGPTGRGDSPHRLWPSPAGSRHTAIPRGILPHGP